MIDADAERSENHRRYSKHERKVDRPQISLVLQEIVEAEGKRRNQKEEKRRIDVERFRQQMDRRLNRVRQRTAATRARFEDREDAPAAAGVHRCKHNRVTDAGRNGQFDRFPHSLCEDPCDEHRGDAKHRCELRRERQREQRGAKVKRAPTEIRAGANHDAPKIRRSREAVTLRAEQRLLRRGHAQDRCDRSNTQQHAHIHAAQENVHRNQRQDDASARNGDACGLKRSERFGKPCGRDEIEREISRAAITQRTE